MRATGLALLLTLAAPAGATDLAAAYREALAHDALYLAASASYEIGRAHV